MNRSFWGDKRSRQALCARTTSQTDGTTGPGPGIDFRIEWLTVLRYFNQMGRKAGRERKKLGRYHMSLWSADSYTDIICHSTSIWSAAAPTDIIADVEKEGNCSPRLSLLTITAIAAPLLISVIVEGEEEETKHSTLLWSASHTDVTRLYIEVTVLQVIHVRRNRTPGLSLHTITTIAAITAPFLISAVSLSRPPMGRKRRKKKRRRRRGTRGGEKEKENRRRRSIDQTINQEVQAGNGDTA